MWLYSKNVTSDKSRVGFPIFIMGWAKVNVPNEHRVSGIGGGVKGVVEDN